MATTTRESFELKMARQKGYSTVEEYRAARKRAHELEMARRERERELAAAARRASRVLREVAPFLMAEGVSVYERTSDGRVRAVPFKVTRAKLLPGNMVGGPVGLASVCEVGPSRWLVRVMDASACVVGTLEIRHAWEVEYVMDAMGCAIEGAAEFCGTYGPLPAVMGETAE